MLWSGDGLQFVMNFFRCRIKCQQESLLSFFCVVRSRFVDEAEGLRIAGYAHDLAEVERPEAERANLNCDDLANNNPDAGVTYPHPAEIELLPFLKRMRRGPEEFESSTYARSRCIVSEPDR